MATDGPGALPPLSREEVGRYSRHLLLPELGMAGQRRLKGSSVLCVGAGGLGSPLLLYLAAAGVGRIGIVDGDEVDASNLQRQVLHGTSTVGVAKVRSAAARLHDVNPGVRVEAHETTLGSHNALELVRAYDVVVDGTDNFPTRYLLNDAAVIEGRPLVYGSIFRFEGQASVFNHDGGPDYRDLYPEPPPPGMVPSCADGGVLGVLPGIIGTIQATETLKLLAGLGTSLSGRLLLYDALALRRDPSRAPITELVDYDAFCGVPGVQHTDDAEGVERLDPRDVQERLQQGWAPYVVDVRAPHEADIVSLPFVDALVPHDAPQLVDAVPRDRDVLLLCRSGVRSLAAGRRLVEAGHPRVFELAGGLLAWAAAVDPQLPTY